MKSRRISLFNYIFFLGIMYGVWYVTIQAKKHGGYNLQGIDDIIDQLNSTIQPKLSFYVDVTFSQDEYISINKTIYNTFKKSPFALSVEQYNVNIPMELPLGATEVEVLIQYSVEQQFIVQNLQSIKILTSADASIGIGKNLKRYLNKFIPIVQNEEQLVQTQYYTNRLLIFDIIVQDNRTQIQYDPMVEIDKGIVHLMKQFKISQDNLRINYKIANNQYNTQWKSTSFKQYTQYNFQKLDMNWMDYFQIQVVTVLSDAGVQFNYDQEEYEFVFIQPNQFLHHSTGVQQLHSNIFDTFMILLQMEELTELRLENSDYQPTIQLLSQHYQKREQVRHLFHFIKELQFIQYIQTEGEYKITIESQGEFEKRVQYIKKCLDSNTIVPTTTVDLVVDDRFSNLDTFSLEYTLGMYLPIILPFAYPILLGIYDEMALIKK